MRPSPLLAALAAALGASRATFRELASERQADLPELWAAARRMAAHPALIGPPSRVLLHVGPGLLWTEAFLAILLAGHAAVPVPRDAPAAELAYFAREADVTLAIVEAATAASMREPAAERGLPCLDVAALEGWAEAATAGASEAGALDGSDHAALILFTSGTTGRPKGAVLTHANLAAQTAALRGAWRLEARDVLLHSLPLHHLHGVVVALLACLSAGASVLSLPRFEVDAVARALPAATIWMAVPAMYERLFARLDTMPEADRAGVFAALAGLRLLTSGSAALPVKWAERVRAITGAIPLERYGMTEIGMALSNPLEPAGREAGCVGRPLPGVELRLVDESGADAEREGELYVRGPSVFAGYFTRGDTSSRRSLAGEASSRRDEATRAAFTEDGWFRTGDIGRREPSGAIRLLGRASSDILKTGGEKVSALEIEEVIRQHPAVLDVAVVGVPDERWGDRVVAAVVARPGEEAACGTEAMRAWLKPQLVPYKIPRDFVALEALPRNAMGKVVKAQVVERVRGVVG